MKFSYPSGTQPLPGYTIKRGIGVGGFGEVYFAISEAGKEVALKKIQRNMDVELRGVRQCLNLNHVNLISLWDIKTTGQGESWVVMEYVPGQSLRDQVEDHPYGMPELEIKKWFAATASGVAYLHKHGIVHRDLKPGNIFRDDDEGVVKIGDYGLSKFMSCSRRSGQTESVGTFHYMAPEIGKGVYGKEIDIYALGIILFEMLSGDVPFNGESSQEIIMKHLTSNVSLEKIPPAFHRVIIKSLTKDPLERFHSVQSMIREMPWPDLASNSDQIVSQHAIGLTSLQPPAEPSAPPVSSRRDLLNGSQHSITPLFVSGQEIEVTRSDIVFGPVTDHSDAAGPIVETDDAVAKPLASRSTAPHPASQSLDPIQVIRVTDHSNAGTLDSEQLPSTVSVSPGKSPTYWEPSTAPPASFQTTAADISNPSATDAPETRLTEQTSLMEAGGRITPTTGDPPTTRWRSLQVWWASSIPATAIKLILLVVMSLLMANFPAAAGILTVITGGICLLYFMVRHSVIPLGEAVQSNLPPLQPAEKKRSNLEKRSWSAYGMGCRQTTQIRQWLGDRPWRVRVTELAGTFLVAAMACTVLNFVSLVATDETLEASAYTAWARYACSLAISIAAAWTILLCSKCWEHRRGDPWLRRVVMTGGGLFVGLVGWNVADFFRVQLMAVDANAVTQKSIGMELHSMPVVPAYLLSFVGLLAILRWWHQADPARRTRLSVGSVGLCLIWATVIGHVLERPVASHALFAVTVAIAVQLAAPWLNQQQRRLICETQAVDPQA